MRIRNHLRRIRAERGYSITDVCVAVPGLARGEVSMFERGHSVPRDDQAERMTAVYGPVEDWYPPSVSRVLLADLADCGGCGDELDPNASAARRYHSDECRQEAHNARRRRRTPEHALASNVPE